MLLQNQPAHETHETQYICDVCSDAITNPLCPFCLTEEIEVWLSKLNSPILESLEATRKSAFKMKGYWL